MLLVLFIGLFTLTSCQDECTQDALCTLVSSEDYGKTSNTAKGLTTVQVCHRILDNDGVTIIGYETLTIDSNALQPHLNHGDVQGECGSLSSDSLEFKDGEVVEIPCSYELPFMHVTANGTQWLYSEPNN